MYQHLPIMNPIHFEATVSNIDSLVILQLPRTASARLPSRGMTMVEGTINETPFQAPLEPDGKGSHWFKLDKSLLKSLAVGVGDTVKLAIAPSKLWPEPEVPADLKKVLHADPEILASWVDITPNARWDWIRWISATKNPETRKRRIEVTCSKFKAGKRRPCCFDRTRCTDPYVSNNGILLEPLQTMK